MIDLETSGCAGCPLAARLAVVAIQFRKNRFGTNPGAAGRYIYLKEGRYQISVRLLVILVICYASDITEYDRRTSELSNSPHHITLDATSIE